MELLAIVVRSHKPVRRTGPGVSPAGCKANPSFTLMPIVFGLDTQSNISRQVEIPGNILRYFKGISFANYKVINLETQESYTSIIVSAQVGLLHTEKFQESRLCIYVL
jgi:hypothetical protein